MRRTWRRMYEIPLDIFFFQITAFKIPRNIFKLAVSSGIARAPVIEYHERYTRHIPSIIFLVFAQRFFVEKTIKFSAIKTTFRFQETRVETRLLHVLPDIARELKR